MGNKKSKKRLRRWGLIALAGIAFLVFLAGDPIHVLAGEKIVLLRLERAGQVIEINPATNMGYHDLDTYLRARLGGKKILEVKPQECRDHGTAIIIIRYEE